MVLHVSLVAHRGIDWVNYVKQSQYDVFVTRKRGWCGKQSQFASAAGDRLPWRGRRRCGRVLGREGSKGVAKSVMFTGGSDGSGSCRFVQIGDL